MRPPYVSGDVKDSLIRAAAALTGEPTYEAVETAFNEVASAMVLMSRLPDIQHIVVQFAAMTVEQLRKRGRGDRNAPPEPSGCPAVDINLEGETPSEGIVAAHDACPTCGRKYE